ncbi:MAG: RtcB family protein [Cyanobacteria bacterium RUI128]|nr:RtcB family protein [Cyanobacteria bacterium RUI128]
MFSVSPYIQHNINSSRNLAFTGNKHDKSINIQGRETTAKVFTDNINESTYEQIKTIVSHPTLRDVPVRIMPDTHAGKNAVVGFTAPVDVSRGIIPGLIGGDIGCGVLCTEVDTKGQDIDYNKLDKVIRTYITPPNPKRTEIKRNELSKHGKSIENKCREYGESSAKAIDKLGTLGNGNHFIEIDKDKEGRTYLVVHSGSRWFGNKIYHHHDKIAQKQNPYEINELSYLKGDEAKEYLRDMDLAIKYSQLNRKIIAEEIINEMGWEEKSSFETIHNYISDDGILRKGAIRSNSGDIVIIPLNMRDGAILAEGKGNPDWNNSAPHGAGRQYSRREANSQLSLDEYQKEMEGIHSSCISAETLDESPMAYKPSEEITDNIQDTVDITDVIKPVFNFKNK